jgi:acetyl esterase/lipase
MLWGSIAGFTVWLWRGSAPVPSLLSASAVRPVEATVSHEGGAPDTHLDVYVPPRDPAAPPDAPLPLYPAVLAIHGGSWIGGSRLLYRFSPSDTVIRLAEHGFVVFATDYHLARPGAPTYAGVIDELRATVRWIRRHAHEFGVDPGRIAALGQSSGGHLASLLGTLPDEIGADGISSKVQAVVNFYGPSDLASVVQDRRLTHEPVRLFVGAASASSPEILKRASPISHVSADDAPMLLIHGSEDRWVFPEQSTRMAEALAAAGVGHRMILVAGARHGFEALVQTPEPRDLMPEILAFLANVWNVP